MPSRVSAFSRWHNGASRTRKTSFDYVALVDQFQQEELSQEELYESSVRPFINRCLQGCSGSIITYGARGSGKSYTLGTLDPQQLSLAARGNGTPGVLSRCTQQLYEWLGEDAAVEVTCVEVQGDDIVDLLEQRPGASAFNKAAATTIDGLNGGPSSTSVAPGCASPVSALSSPQAGFSRSPIAFAAASASSRRKPLTATVVRNLAEALLTLQRAVSNRQVFSTATRHNSSRTHAVFQLRWRNPAAPAATGGCGCVASAVTGAAGYGSCGGAALRPFSAPPRSALTGAPLGSPPPGTRVPDGGGSGGPVCTLTLVDTCSFCPLLPPKEASAVKRSLLALGRVLSALQRRHSMTLRESKLTRMLEGAVDQILLLACMCGVGDESTVQLVKTLQQGSHMRDNALRRSRRASSSDSRQASGAWESAASLCAVSAVSLAGVAGLAQHGVVTGSTADAIGTPPRVLVGKAAGLGPSRALFRSPKSPHGQGYGIQRAAAELTELPLALSTVPSGDGKSSSGGGGTDTDAVAMPPMSESSPGESSSSPAASSRSGGGDGDGASVATSAAVLPLAAAAKAGRPEPLTIDVMSTDTLTLCSPGATGVAAPERRTPLSSGCRRAGSAIPSPPGMSPVGPSASRLSGTLSSRERPASVTARAAPGPEVRRSQGFSVLQGKWSPPPPPVSHANDKTFPIVPCCIASGASATGQSLSLMRTNAAISTDSGVPLAAPGKPAAARGGIGTSGTRGRTSPGRGSLAKSGASSGRGSSGSASALTALSLTAAAKVKRVSHDSAASSRSCGGRGGGGGGSLGPAPTDLEVSLGRLGHAPSAVSSGAGFAATAANRPATAGLCSSPAAGASTPGSARRRPNIPVRPPVRSPQPSPPSPFAGNAHGTAPPRTSQRPSVRASPSVNSATLISLAEVPPTRLTSTRYDNTNASHDSTHEGMATAAASAASALLTEPLADGPSASQIRLSLTLRNQTEGAALGGGAGLAAGARARSASGVSSALSVKRSISSGTRWPSPLLRARRTEWLEDTRRSRSALPRPVTEIPEPQPDSALGPRKPPDGFRCAPMSRPTLSAQYKDLLLDFEAFKARARMPRQRRSTLGAATPRFTPLPSARTVPASSPGGNPSPDRHRQVESTISPAASSVMTHGSGSTKQGSTVLLLRLRTAIGACSTAVPAGSPAGSTGLPPGSQASTPQDSARPVSGSCARPPPVFSRAHSPTADEGLLSLTAAAAAAATAGGSPRTAVSVGTPPSGRPRPGVSRGSGAAMSPRLLRSPERPATPVSPTTVLDMSRLFAAKSSPTAAAGTQPPSSQQPGSGRGPRLSAGSARQLASGGSDRYKRMVEDDVDSVRTSEAEGDSEGERAHSDAVSYPSGDSDSDRDNLLGPGGLENLGLMLEAGGSVAALHDSISRQGESSVTSPAGSMATPASQRRTSARSAATATPTSVRICALQAAGARRGYDRRPDEELPAVSFFIPRFTPRGDSSNASPAGVLRSVATAPVATALAAAGTSIAGVSATGAAAQVTSTSAAGSRPRAQTGGTELLTVPVEAAQEAACSGGRQLNAGSGARRTLAPALLCADNQSQPEAQPEYEEAAAELQPRRERVSGAVAAGSAPGAVAAAAAAAVAQLAQLQLLYIARDRVSGSSDVLQGSCTTLPADLDGATACKYSDGGQALPPPSQPEEEEEEENEEEVEEAALQGKPLEGRSGSARASPYRKRQAKPVLSTAVMGKAALGPPSHSSISLRQLLQQQLMQQRPGRRTAGRVAAAIAAAAGPRKGSPKPNSPAQGYTAPTPQAAAGLLAQRAVVRPNHMDLDEHSTVLLVDGDCASESDATVLALAAARAAAAAVPRRASAWGNQVTQAGDAGSAGTAGGVSAAGGDDDVSKTHLVVSGCPPLSAPSVPLPESPFAIRITKRSPRQPPQLPTPSSLSQTSVRERVAALEGVQSPGTAANVPPHHTPSQTMKSWAQEVSGDGGSHSSSCALVSAAVPGGRLGVAQTRSAPSPSATTLTNAVADALQRQAVIAAASRTAAVVIPQPSVRSGSGSGSGTGSGSRSGADHQPYPSLYSPTGTLDSGGGRYGSSPTLPGGAGARCPAMAVAAGLASRPSAATPAVQVARSIDGDPGTHRSTPRQHALQLLPQQQHQQQRPQHHNQSKHQSQQQQQSQFMATLRASGNVAAAWRAAAAKSTSSYSSVRSCFRSNSGQHQHSMLGSDATAVATVVAVSRAAPLGVGEEKHALGRTSGHVAAAAATAAAVKWSGGLEHLPGNGAFTTVLGGGVMPVTGGTTPMAGSSPASPPRLPPHPRGHQSGTTFANRLPSSETYVSKTLPPSNANEAAAVTPAAAAIANPATPAVVTASAAAGLTTPGILAKAKSARGERMTPLTARLWAFKSYRTPRPAVATPVARLGEEEAEPLPPPPAYPPGFVGWATKMFSKSKKNKLASLK